MQQQHARPLGLGRKLEDLHDRPPHARLCGLRLRLARQLQQRRRLFMHVPHRNRLRDWN